MDEILRPTLGAVSIDTSNGWIPALTPGQAAIIRMLRSCATEKRPFTRYEVCLCYHEGLPHNSLRIRTGIDWAFDALAKRHYQVGQRVIPIENREEVVRHMWYSARPWFTTNIGSCILKGRILALPVIDI